MNSSWNGMSLFAKISWSLLSVPILIKMVGIGAIIAAMFGGITFVQTRQTLKEDLNAVLADRALNEAESLAAQLARPLSVNDIVAVKEILRDAKQRLPDMIYVIVRRTDGRVLSHTFKFNIPAGLAEFPTYVSNPDQMFRVIDAGESGLVFEAMRKIVKGHAGHVQVGLSRRMISDELASLRNTIITSLSFCIVIGIALALILSFAITRPVYHLEDAVGRIRRNELDARAPVFSDDEIGNLATAFNDMAEMLQRNEQVIVEKERARTALVERVISSQENERKVISRELHDQVGQSLLALLVDMRSQHGNTGCVNLCLKHEDQVESLIDEVRQVSKGMHPAILDDYGLDLALKNYTDEITARHSVKADYESNCIEGAGRFPETIEIAFYRVAQEAISNALRHASPEHISVILLSTGPNVTLLIEDDGVGFDADPMLCSTGLGLVSMRERVSLIGGDLDITSAAGEGTTVRVRVTLANVEEYHI